MSSNTTSLRLRGVERVVANGSVDAEYILFDPGEIELRSSSYGEVREVGYRTTVKRGKPRLASLGLTPVWIEDVRRAFLTSYGLEFVRGATLRRLAAKMSAAQLFEAREYRSEAKHYIGSFVDTVALSAALDLPTHVLQIAYLAALTFESSDSEEIFLDTRHVARERRLGERTYRRVSLKETIDLPSRFAQLPKAEPTAAMSKLELVSLLEGRTHEDASGAAAWAPLATAALARDKPTRGPLAEDDLWEIEMEMDQKRNSNVLERLEAIERQRGKMPGTTYLRARLALDQNREPPEAIAERLASLSLSVNPFPELVLLTAIAWGRAGDFKRALPFARDVVATPNAEPALVKRAQEIVGRMERISGAPPARGSRPPTSQVPPTRASGRPSNAPPVPSDRARLGAGATIPAAPMPIELQEQAENVTSPSLVKRASAPPPKTVSQSMSSVAEGRYSVVPSQTAVGSAPRRLSEPRVASQKPDPREEAEPLTSRANTESQARGLEPPKLPSSSLMRAVLSDRGSQPPKRPTRELDMPPPVIRESRPDTLEATPIARRSDAPPLSNGPGSSPPADPYMAGSARPFFRLEQRDVVAPIRRRPFDALLLEGLSLGPDVHNVPRPVLEPLPQTPSEARALFTVLTRELGADYRRRFGLELLTDLKSVEIAQTYLRDAYPMGKLDAPGALFDVHRHGAFISELFARWFDAEWDDIKPADVGQWSMFVPPRHRIWPFGRVLRFLRKGHRERDLVSYVLELEMLRRDAEKT